MDKLNPLAEAIKQYIADRLATKLEAFDNNATKQLVNSEAEQVAELEQKLSEKRAELLSQYEPKNWLTDAARRASQISMVTHAPKYTHSDTQSIGINLKNENKTDEPERYLHSQIFNDLTIDVFGNSAALDVAGMLQQEVQGQSLLIEVASGYSPVLKRLAANDEQYQTWLRGFHAALQDRELTTDWRSKQLYFPLENNYHLISPLYATSLSQKFHEKLTGNFYSESRDAKRKGRYSSSDLKRFPDIAVQNFGGANAQNISQLNKRRNGRGYLLSSQPPTWDTQTSVPAGGKYSFWRQYDRRAWRTVKNLRDYLERIAKRTSTVERRDRRVALVDELIDILLICAAEIQQLHDRRGWSTTTDLSLAEQLWLDPYRCELDEEFKQQRGKSDWQSDIARQFATWLNSRLSYKSALSGFGDVEFQEWNRLLERKLLLLKEDLEVGR